MSIPGPILTNVPIVRALLVYRTTGAASETGVFSRLPIGALSAASFRQERDGSAPMNQDDRKHVVAQAALEFVVPGEPRSGDSATRVPG